MKGEEQKSPRLTLLLAGIVTLALAGGLVLHRQTITNPFQAASSAGHRNTGTSEAAQEQAGLHDRKRLGNWKEQRLQALDLAGRIGGKQSLISSDHMLLKGEEDPFPSALVREAAAMTAAQLRVLVLELGKNPQIQGTNRAMLVATMTDAWLVTHEAGKKQSLRAVLGMITEVMPTLPRGFDTLPVSCAMGRSLLWDLPAWTDFMEAHWGRWAGPHGNQNAEVMRRDLLKVLDDPQLRARIENLPRAGAGN